LVGRRARRHPGGARPAARRDPGARAARDPADGAGCGADGWPDDDEALVDAAGRIHLCPAAPGSGAADLGRRAVIAALFGFDRAAGWSEDPAWRRLNGWRWSMAGGFRPRSDNIDPAGSRRRGAAARRAGIWPRSRRRCCWTPQATATATPASAAASSVRPPSSTRGWGADAPRCQGFRALGRSRPLEAVEVVLAAPSTAMVGSLFGHLFVRLAYRDDAGETPPHLARTVAFLADTSGVRRRSRLCLEGYLRRVRRLAARARFPGGFREYVVIEGRICGAGA